MADPHPSGLVDGAAAALRAASRVVALTGAGVSAESGIPTFRGEDGLWGQFRAEDLATPEAFRRDPELVWEWYNWRRTKHASAQPNPAHHALATLQDIVPHFALVTQNVDGLHAASGSRDVLELHGNVWRVRCVAEGTTWEDRRAPLPELPPRCECGALLRPDVVWFGETLPPDVVRAATDAAEAADVALVVGTSSIIYPAAGLPLLCLARGGTVIEINRDPTPLTPEATIALHGLAGEVLPRVVERVQA